MSWQEKFEATATRVNELLDSGVFTGTIESDFFIAEVSASEESLALLKERFPYVPESYLQFLRRTNGANLCQCSFYATEESNTFFAYGAGEIYNDTYPKERWFVFGHDAGGNPMMIHHTGQVAIGYGKSNDESDHRILGPSFEHFMDEVLMGPLYSTLYDGMEEGDTWYAYLVEQGWA